jgi:hypothetical protein
VHSGSSSSSSLKRASVVGGGLGEESC